MNRKLLFTIWSCCCCISYASSQPKWTALPARFDWPVSCLSADSATNTLYMGGMFTKVNDTLCTTIKWDGSAFTLLPRSPIFHTGQITTFKGKLIVAGNPGLAVFDGMNWTRIDSSGNTGIGCLRLYGNDLIIGGMFDSIAGKQIANGVIWDGANSWSDLFRVDTLLADPEWLIKDFDEYKGELYVAGNINPPGKPTFTEIARFDGHRWKDVGGGIHGNGFAAVSKMLEWKGELYVSGEFFERDGAPGNCIAKWNGSSWQRLGEGIRDISGFGEAAIYDMVVFRDTLYVVGTFERAGDIPAQHIARWDGNKWCASGSAFELMVTEIETYKDELYIAGGFSSIDGDTTIKYLAKWTGGNFAATCSSPVQVAPTVGQQMLSVFPNPSSDVFYITYLYGFSSSSLSLEVRNVLGRVVLRQIELPSSSRNMISIDLQKQPSGVYYLHANLPSARPIILMKQ